MLWLTRSTARSGGTVTSMTTATTPEAGIVAVGVLPRSGWVAVTNAPPSRRSSVSPSGAVTAIDVRVTGAANPLVTNRSYSRWSSPSLPDTRRGSFVAETTMAVVFSPTAGEATGVASCAHPFPGSAAMAPPSRLAARTGRSREIIMVTPRRARDRRCLVIPPPKQRSFRAAGTHVVPGIRVAHALEHLLDRLCHQLGLILVNVMPALGGRREIHIQDKCGQVRVPRAKEPFQLPGRESRRLRRLGERLAVGQDGQGHRLKW